MRNVDVVQHNSQQIAADLLNHLLGTDGHRLRIAAVLNDLQDCIYFAGEDGGIAHAHDRGRVEEHVIVPAL